MRLPGLDTALRPAAWLGDRLGVTGYRHRRVWAEHGHAHIEAHAIEQSRSEGLRERLQATLERVDAVHWAEVNAVTRRVAVAFDGGKINLDTIIGLIEAVEEADDVHDTPFPEEAPDHPGDAEPARRALTALAGDVVGLSLSLVGRVARRSPLPVELASLLSFVDSQPRLRSLLEQRLGRSATDMGLALTNAFAQGIAEGPYGLAVDIVHRGDLLTEIRARRRVWSTREPELYANPRGKPIACPPVGPRPVPLPDGPVERYADQAGLASLGGFAVTLAATRDPRRATQALLAGMPKAARLGRESFAAQLGRTLAKRGIVPLDSRALRRLDRVDTVIVDAEVLTTGRAAVGDILTLNGAQPADIDRHARSLLDPDEPSGVRGRGEWTLGPLEQLDADVPRGGMTRARELRRGGARVVGLARTGELTGLVSLVAELDPASRDLVAAVRRAGHTLVVAGTRGGVGPQLGADRVVPRGERFADAVHELQAEGAVVMVISARAHGAMAAADCAVGLVDPRHRPSWCADLLLCDRGLDAATFLVEASAEAVRVSGRSTSLAMGGSVLAGLLALTGPRTGAGHRGLAAVNSAAVASMAAGTWSGMALARKPAPLRPDPTPWHETDGEEALRRLASSPAGLPAEEVSERHAAAQAEERHTSGLERLARPFLAELANPITPVLALGAGTSAVIGSVVDAALVGGLIGVNAVAGGIQRLRTERAVERLLHDSAPRARVRRDGNEIAIAADELVTGDVLIIDAGEVVPADCRLLSASGLEIDESAVTGESLPVAKDPAPCPEPALADRTCMLYEGTTVTAGTGEAVVVATGGRTEASRTLLAADADAPASGVEARLQSLTTKLLPTSLAAAGGVAALGLWRGWPGNEVVGSGVSLAVASVPEGLPFVATAAQLSAARRLSRRGALVRNPRTIEALGRVDVLCFDKTGTLTEGRLRLRCVSDGTDDGQVDGLSDTQTAALAAALRATPMPEDAEAALNTTDEAIRAGAASAGVHPADGADGWQAVTHLPFEASRGFHATLGACRGGARLSLKGAPERVLPRCATWRGARLDERARTRLREEVERLAREGLRVLAVAERTASRRDELDEEHVEDLDFLGLLALGDPVRSSAAAAVADLRRAGVEVLMVTGDHPSTARAIAAELALGEDDSVLTGADIDGLDGEALTQALAATSVVARVAPSQKLRVVRALQEAGHAVAMTGDGANDAPSIRLADVGVALGERATPTARQAADVVVADGRIETLIDAIVEGRALWGSVRDALSILVGGNLGEIGFSLATSTVARRAPMNARQFLLVNLLTDLAPAMAVVLRPPKPTDPQTLLHEGPDRSLGSSLNRDLAVRAVATAGGASGAWLAARATGTTGRARTVALVALVGSQLGQTLVAGGRSVPIAATSLGSAAVLAGIVQTPGISHFFGCRPLGPVGWATATGAATVATAGSTVALRVLRSHEASS